ncbi:glycoside hydrolase family 13 protein [Planococcus faecalis]|uniref:Alpha-amylase n=1 Tax=Planococcus faecalis TaxID=1598147 RepID=A0ABN4XNN8_9BACL|nr:alpha-glucosidase [Planococcus faecalis]AQU78389.1 glucohydrolase [Planococcus faecalis]OHX52411.1 glucohydrolase [Planococcus faecalis]
MNRKWWKEAVVYQVYPRSFMDSDGNGLGDINGITSKLDYLKGLGIDVIWVCPMYKSPNDDNGYDISDYQEILEDFGTMEDFDLLMEQVHARDMKLIIDLVINHTSDEHPWFLESSSSRDHPKRDWYVWRDEPLNWESIFGGPAWEYDEKTKQYFLHIFSKKQPDLNWENPEVRKELYKMINWWIARGIDGFRVDAISHIKKDYTNTADAEGHVFVPSWEKIMNVDGIQPMLQELYDETFGKHDIMTVGEANGVSADEIDEWVSEKTGKFNMIFQFEDIDLWNIEVRNGVNVPELKHVLSKWQNKVNGVGWNALFIENHDRPRVVSTWGNDQQYWRESATALACMYFFMQGTPFIYQGQEIGMTNAPFEELDHFDDVHTHNLYFHKKETGMQHEAIMTLLRATSRDHSRTPMQWDNTLHAGFSDASPWMGINPNYQWLNVKAQENDPHSVLAFYKQMIWLRKNMDVFVYGEYKLIEMGHEAVFAYTREYGDDKVFIVTNLAQHACMCGVNPENSTLLLGNYSNNDSAQLLPYEARVYKVPKDANFE